MSKRWDDYFFRLALEAARMSKDPSTRVGAVIVGADRQVLSTGFNGFPRGLSDDPAFYADRERKMKLVVHAEMNAILNAARTGVALKGSTMYLLASNEKGKVWGGPPCVRCTVEIIQAGISAIISRPWGNVPDRWREDMHLADRCLSEARISYREVAP